MSEMPPLHRRGFRPRIPGTLPVMGAALLWSTLGLFFRYLISEAGMSPSAIAFARAAGGGAVLAAFLALRWPRGFTVVGFDILWFAVGGFVSVTVFYICFIEAVQRTSVAVAVVLLYTAPVWVAALSWVFWGEALTRLRAAALILATTGVALVATGTDVRGLPIDRTGLMFGLAAGLTYALYSIYGTWALERYSSITVVMYAMLFGALFLLPLQGPGSLAPVFSSPAVFLAVAALIAGPTIGAYALYTYGMARTGASTASIMATLEPVAAAVLAWLVLGESPGPVQAFGGLMVIAALLLLSHRPVEKGKVTRLN